MLYQKKYHVGINVHIYIYIDNSSLVFKWCRLGLVSDSCESWKKNYVEIILYIKSKFLILTIDLSWEMVGKLTEWVECHLDD